MLINKSVISNLSPCSSRFNNYLDHYKNFNESLDNFLDLDKITYSDKIWVASRLLNKNQLVHFGLLCAESVLNIYEDKYPKDKRVKDCIEYLKTIKNYDNISSIEREKIKVHTNATNDAANAAANAANAVANAANAAYYAANVAYYAANVAYYAANAANAVAYYAANAANAAYYAAARIEQENLNLEYLKIAASI